MSKDTDDPLFWPSNNHVLLAADMLVIAQMVIFVGKLIFCNFIFQSDHTPFCFSMWIHWNRNTQECTVVATVSVASCLRLLAPLSRYVENDPNTSMCWRTRLASKQWCWSHKIKTKQWGLRYLARGHYLRRTCHWHQVCVFNTVSLFKANAYVMW